MIAAIEDFYLSINADVFTMYHMGASLAAEREPYNSNTDVKALVAMGLQENGIATLAQRRAEPHGFQYMIKLRRMVTSKDVHKAYDKALADRKAGLRKL